MVRSTLNTSIKTVFFVFIAVLLSNNLWAQNRTENYNLWSEFKSDRSDELYLRFENTNFFDNNEFNSPHAVGSTLVGSWGRAMAEYYFNEDLRVQLGFHALKFFGKNTFSNLSEWFSVVYQPMQQFRLIFGDLDLYHYSIHESILDPRLFLSNPNHRGVQGDYMGNNIQLGLFLDWEQFIQQGDNFQEIFSAGFISKLDLWKQKNFSISIPFTLIGRHQGGEIDVANLGIETLFNTSLAVKAIYKSSPFVSHIQASVLTFNDVTESFRQKFDRGYAFTSDMGVSYKTLSMNLMYWHSYRFYASHGNQIFLNYSHFYPDMIFNQHDIFSIKGSYKVAIKEVATVSLEGDFLYDIGQSTPNFIMSLRLILAEEFFIGKLKKRVRSDY